MIPTRRRHRALKPEGAFEIDWAHPWAADLVVAVCPSEGAGPLRDLVSGNRAAAGPGGSWSAMRSGRAVTFNTSQYAAMATRALAALASGYTLVWGGRWGVETSWDSWGGLFCLPADNGAKSFAGVQRDASNDRLHLFHNDYAGFVLNTTITAYANSDLVLGLSWDGANVREFRNGALVQTGVPTFTPQGSVDNKIHINSERALSGEGNQTFSFFYAFKRRLSDAAIADLSSRPFQIVSPSRRIVALRGGAGASTASPADATAAQLADAVGIAQIHAVLPLDSTEAQGADAGAVAQTHGIAVADATHVLQSDAGSVTQSAGIAAADAGHMQAADATGITQLHAVLPADARQGQSADSGAVSSGAIAVINDGVQGQAAEACPIAQNHGPGVADARQAQFLDMAVLVREGVRAPAERHVRAVRDNRRRSAGPRSSTIKPQRK